MTSARRWLLLAGFVLTIFGSKLWLIDYAGSDLPVLDQWDGQAKDALLPWLEQRLTFADLAAPHNEHRLITTRLYSIALLALTGQWSGVTEAAANAAIHAGAALLMLLGARRWLRGVWLSAFGALLIALFSLPLAWENTLVGFQIQFYFLQIFSLAHVYLSLERDRFSWRWAVGQLCALLAVGSMASGFLSSAAVLAALGYRVLRERRWTAQQIVTASLALGLVFVGWWTRTEVAGHASLKAQGIVNFASSLLALLAWPGPAILPWIFAPIALLLARTLRRSPAASEDFVLLGLIGWSLLQCAALAYGRGGGGGLAPRYFDLLSINVALGFIAIAVTFSGRSRLVAASVWFGATALALALQAQVQWRNGVVPMISFHHLQQDLVRSALQTSNPSVFEGKTWPEIPYPSAEVLRMRLDTPALREILAPGARKPIPLHSESTATDTTVPAALRGSPVRIAFSSASAGGSPEVRWRSAVQPATTLPVLRFRVAGDLGPKSSGLRLIVKSAAGETEVCPDSVPGERWKRVAVTRPHGPWWVEAIDSNPTAWFALTDPVELTHPTWFIEKIVKCHSALLLAGVALLVAGGACSLRPPAAPLSSPAPSSPAPAPGPIPKEIPVSEKRMRWRRRLVLFAFLLGAAAVFLAYFPGKPAAIEPLPAASETGEPVIGTSVWAASGVVVASSPPSLRRLALRGSWLGGDGFTGEHITGWYRAGPDVSIMLAGYPALAGNQLTIEARTADGRIERVVFTGTNPTERWLPWKPPLPPDTAAIRVLASDGATVWGGWLGFSEPFAPSLRQTFDLGMVVRTLCTVALTLVLVLGPGYVGPQRGAARLWRTLWLGPLLLATGGGVCWLFGGGVLNPAQLAVAWVVASLVGIAWLAIRRRSWETWSSLETRLLALIALCVLGTAARAAFSGGPEGELYGGTISRTLQVGARSDSRISYHTVQLIAHHLSPHEPEGRKFFLPWDFSSRGPLGGLAAAPIVLAAGGRPPLTMPDQIWAPFDKHGFAAYRIALIGLAALGLVAVSVLMLRVADANRALLAIGLLSLAPFFWHELYFTWPKMIAAAWTLASFRMILDRRPLLAALWLGGGFLWHPLVLLSVPFLGLWLLVCGPAAPLHRLWQGGLFGVGVLAIFAGWNLLNAGHTSQGGFLEYFLAADGLYNVSASAWWLSRWNNFANTLIPFHVLFASADAEAFNALGTRSSEAVHFFLQYWTSAPFAVGIATWIALLPAFFTACRRHPWIAVNTLVAPAVLFFFYMGIVSTGIMRDGGHVLFLSGWAFLAWAAADQVPAWVVGGGFSLVRAVEVLAMMFVPAMATASPWLSDDWLLNDVFWLLVAVASLGGVAWQISRRDNMTPSPEVSPNHTP